jgi:LuxR family transcriptional regulator, maltose regulon positive regulatory protein
VARRRQGDHGRRLTLEQPGAIDRRLAAGETYEEVAAAIGCDPRTATQVRQVGPGILARMERDIVGHADAVDLGSHGVERFPFTKFLPPSLDARVVADGIVARLDGAIRAHQVTLLLAPAGSGKTTAMAAWAADARDPVIWVRLGADENEPVIAARALLEAGRRWLGLDFGRRLARLLDAGAADPTTLVTALVNDLGDGPPVVLALDDVHEVSAAAAAAFLDALLDHLPPVVRVVMSSRAAPALSLARRRVRGQLAELGLADLRLDRETVRGILAQATVPTDAQVDAVLEVSGGWAAAVRLATVHVGTEGPERAGVAGTGEVRGAPTIGDVASELSTFLDEEILDLLPERLRTFLLDTAILDELSPEVCDAITGGDDSRAVLVELDRRNLFITRHADHGGDTWRLHDLFAAFLREELTTRWPAEWVRELHRRAALELAPMRALPHLLAAGEHDEAAAVIVELAFADADASTVVALEPWIRSLPEDVVERHHRLAMVSTWNARLTGRSQEVVKALEPVRDGLRARGECRAAAEVAAALGEAYLQLGQTEQAGQALDEVLAEPVEPIFRITGLVGRAWWHYFRGDWGQTSATVEEALDLAEQSTGPAVSKALLPSLNSLLLFVDQGPAWLVERAERLAAGLDESDSATLTAMRGLRGGAGLLGLDLKVALPELRACLVESAEIGRLAWKHQEAELHLMGISLGTGDLAGVHAIVDGVLHEPAVSPVHANFPELYVHAALRAAWLAGEHRRLARTSRRLLTSRPATSQPTDLVVRALAEAMVARAEGRGPMALAALAEAERVQREGRCWWWVGMPGLERASILLESGRAPEAVEAAMPTLDTAAELGAGILFAEARVQRSVLEHCAAAGVHAGMARAVLEAIDAGGAGREPASIPGTDESLSGREREVLEQVAAGATNREIAEALFIAEGTVKSHLTRVLRKLQASSRTHAVARARELRLL